MRQVAIRGAKNHVDNCLYLDFFSKHKEILFLDSKRVLEIARKTTPVYYKTDFHWNTLGASYMGRRIVNFLAEAEGKSRLWTANPIVTETPGYSGTQNLYLAIFSPETEISYGVENALSDKFQLLPQPPYPFEFYTVQKSAKTNLIPKTVIIGNSFSPYFFNTDFPAYFQELGYLFKGHFKATPIDLLIPPGTKYLILQVNEFDLGTYYMEDAVWEFLKNK